MSWVKEADLPDLPEIFKAISSNGRALDLVERLNEGIAFGSSALTRAQEEAIATTVSVANRCRYGALTHGGFFRKHAGDSNTASQLLADHTQADLSPSDHVMLDFSVKVTLDPADLTQQDLEGLREAGFADDQIVSIVLVTCLFNFMNRIANSLGVAVPEPFARSVERWLTGPAAEEAWLLGPDAGRQSGKLNWRGLEKALGDLSKTIPPQAEDSPPETAADAPVIVEEAAPSNEPTSDAPLSEPQTAEIALNEGLPQVVPGDEDSPEDAAIDPVADSEAFLADTAPKADLQLDQFMSDCCTVSGEEACSARDLYVAYLMWCDLNRNPPALQRNFGLGLSEMGFQRRRRSHGQHWWLGISVATGATGQMAA